MKSSSFISVLALLALCSVTTVRAAAPAAELAVNRVAARTAVNGDRVEAGTTRLMVSMRLGSPSAVLADGSWLYYGYDASAGSQGLVENRTLIVRFVANKVSSLSLADEAAVVALRSAPRSTTKTQLLATK